MLKWWRRKTQERMKNKLEKQHSDLLEKAVEAQRKGDIKTYSFLTASAEELVVKIEEAERALEQA